LRYVDRTRHNLGMQKLPDALIARRDIRHLWSGWWIRCSIRGFRNDRRRQLTHDARYIWLGSELGDDQLDLALAFESRALENLQMIFRRQVRTEKFDRREMHFARRKHSDDDRVLPAKSRGLDAQVRLSFRHV
jgi:hypothetical protein